MNKKCKIKYPIKKPGYSTRATQSILQYGVGAMIDFPDQTLMTAAPEFWANSVSTIHDSRLEKALGVEYFGMPGEKSGNTLLKEGISYVRFPEWYFCPVCRRFKPLKAWIKEHEKFASERAKSDDKYMIRKPKCYKDHCDLVAAGLITVCENGHINDFPWIEWAHIKSYPKKEVCNSPQLRFRAGTSYSEGMQGLVVECDNCHARATLKDAFVPGVFDKLINEDGRTEFCCLGKHPWKGTQEACMKPPVTKQRGDTAVYFPCSVSSIVIPTSSDGNTNVIKESIEFKKIITILDDCDDEEERNFTIEKKFDKWVNNISNQTLIKNVSVRKVLKKLLLDSIEEESENIEVNSIEYKYEEFCALSGIDDKEILGSEDFLREEPDISEYDIPYVKKVVLVKKLREVRALIGFSRLKPVSADKMDSSEFVCIKDVNTNWYPGYEVKGEGIFIEFDQKALNDWSKTDFAVHRHEVLMDNYLASSMSGRVNESIDVVYVFLHTLSHLLLKQLSFECGYNIASLKERLYYKPIQDEEDDGMAGILLYTASGDSEGTLGGLVRQGRSDCFARIFREAVDKARICSNDPVCITSVGQGRESLNLAACHSCALIPETSCERFNILLDRALVVGTFEEPTAGVYSSWKVMDYSISQEETNNDSSLENDNCLVEVCDEGQMQTGTYKEIWEYIKEDTDRDDEKRIFDELIKKSVRQYEKPIYDGAVKINGERILINMLWVDSKVALFLTDDSMGYDIMKNDTSWKVFCQGKESIDVNLLLKCIEVN